MTTSAKTQRTFNEKGRIKLGLLGYTRQALRSNAFNLLHREIEAAELPQAEIAKRIGKDKSWLSRTLGAPNNITLDTLSDLVLAITGKQVELTLHDPARAPRQNFDTYAWLPTVCRHADSEITQEGATISVESRQPSYGSVSKNEDLPEENIAKGHAISFSRAGAGA
ncbi:MAG: hypothetical protein V7703_03485 [Hyphomicrobiales bacterium]